MSLNVTPECASCGVKSSGAPSIVCTRCLELCCLGCFSSLVRATVVTSDVNLTLPSARICWKCNGGEGSAVAEEEVCSLHGRMLSLYCENCSEVICGGCIEPGEQHAIHRVENLAAMYLDRVARTGAKLIRAKTLNDELHADAAAYTRNLELLEKEEEAVLKEVEAMVESCTLQVSQMTTGRKEAIKEKLRIPTANDAVLDDIKEAAKQLSPYGLLRKLPEFEKKLDQLIAQDKAHSTLQKVHDVHCDLIPRYQYTSIEFAGFKHAATGDAQDYVFKSAYDVEWQLMVRKAATVQIVPSTKDPEVRKFRHMLVVIIPHPDYAKTIQETFELLPGQNAYNVAWSSPLVEQGFCSKDSGDLELRIGIRCLNVVIEKQLLDYQYGLIRNYLIMHFHPKLNDVKYGKDLQSLQVKDGKMRCWALSMGLKDGYVGFYVELQNGSPACSEFFVELINTDPMKTIIYRTKHTFAKGKTWGWPDFVRLDKVIDDVGFHPAGTLHVRFGVRPLVSSAKTSEARAANP